MTDNKATGSTTRSTLPLQADEGGSPQSPVSAALAAITSRLAAEYEYEQGVLPAHRSQTGTVTSGRDPAGDAHGVDAPDASVAESSHESTAAETPRVVTSQLATVETSVAEVSAEPGTSEASTASRPRLSQALSTATANVGTTEAAEDPSPPLAINTPSATVLSGATVGSAGVASPINESPSMQVLATPDVEHATGPASMPAPPVFEPASPRGDAEPLVDRLPPEPADDVSSRRRSRWNTIGMITLAVFVISVAAASFIQLPYYRIEPGSVYDTIERVEAPGESIFIPEGDIGFVTVSQTPDITIWQWLDAKLDENVLIRHEDEINGDQTQEQKREQDQRRMQQSKSAAVVVALQRLGFDLVVTPIGIEVASIFDCTAADGVLGTGDLIVAVDGVDTLDGPSLIAQLADSQVGQQILLTVERIDPANSAMTLLTEDVTLTLGSADATCLPADVRADEPRAFIGIGTNPLFEEELPLDVNIRTDRVGGPSAGLAFTLAIMDVLSEGELTNGLNIVVTGTIDRNGNVGPVGGIHQKTVAAERSGADVFIVPMCCDNWVDRDTGDPLDLPSNYEEALEHADEMRVIGVDNLDDALAAIAELGGDIGPFVTAE